MIKMSKFNFIQFLVSKKLYDSTLEVWCSDIFLFLITKGSSKIVSMNTQFIQLPQMGHAFYCPSNFPSLWVRSKKFVLFGLILSQSYYIFGKSSFHLTQTKTVDCQRFSSSSEREATLQEIYLCAVCTPNLFYYFASKEGLHMFLKKLKPIFNTTVLQA